MITLLSRFEDYVLQRIRQLPDHESMMPQQLEFLVSDFRRDFRNEQGVSMPVLEPPVTLSPPRSERPTSPVADPEDGYYEDFNPGAEEPAPPIMTDNDPQATQRGVLPDLELRDLDFLFPDVANMPPFEPTVYQPTEDTAHLGWTFPELDFGDIDPSFDVDAFLAGWRFEQVDVTTPAISNIPGKTSLAIPSRFEQYGEASTSTS